MSIVKKLQEFFQKESHESASADKEVVKTFKKRYARFRKLIDSNSALAENLAEINSKLSGKSLFGSMYVQHLVSASLSLTRKMVESLIDMHPGAYNTLLETLNRIEANITAALNADVPSHKCSSLTLPLHEIDVSHVDCVGGKCANLGEMLTKVGAPVPRGFAITTSAFHLFLGTDGLRQFIEKKLTVIDPENRIELGEILGSITERILATPLPTELEKALQQSWQESFGNDTVSTAIRSSAQTEDGDKSFAGQFLTELNVQHEHLGENYRKVIASLFTPSATLYRLHQGVSLDASAMAVACLEMIKAKASGVAYSHDPVNILDETIIINGVWGLGSHVVDGTVQPDVWIYSREAPQQIIRKKIGNKDKKLVIDPINGLHDQPTTLEERKALCLDDSTAEELTQLVMRLENHYGCFQDVEWAISQEGKLFLLQSRPLDIRGGRHAAPKPPLLKQYTLLLDGGDIAYAGVGAGPVFQPKNMDDLVNFPKGGILVATHSKAAYASIVDKAQAIITEIGGVTGHMATICREFHVPALLNVPHATNVLKPGIEITVDALSGRIYEGIVQELLPLRMETEAVHLQDTPVYTTLKKVARFITPLNLTDPHSSKFSPAGCQTLHDIMRFTHEQSYHEMFAISNTAVAAGRVAMKLKAPLPIDLHIIDLDNGTNAQAGAKTVTPEEITSVPLQAFLGGMLHPEVMFRRPRPINIGGFMSVVGQQMASGQNVENRFGDKSYAIISDRYMNFSSRVGYHYSVLDAYCGATMSKNYISFNFQGGAAGQERRERRCRAITLVLQELEFTVDQNGDLVKSRLQKYEQAHIQRVLDYLGRLVQVTRQMDMLMVDESSVVQFKNDFMNGIYR